MNKDVSRRDFVKSTATGAGAAAVGGFGARDAGAAQRPPQWDRVADVVVVGAGATGLPAAIEAVQNGASVILVERNFDVGGHAIQSGGSTPLGGGTSLQKKHGIVDTPDLYYADLVGDRNHRYNDRDLMRAFVDMSAPTFEWVVACGVVFPDSLDRRNAAPHWKVLRNQGPVWTQGVGPLCPTGGNGTALIRPLEATARKLGVEILLEHSLTGLVRETSSNSRVLGITVTTKGRTLNIQARRGVIIGTGGHSSNVNFRRMFDSRLTEEYQVVGEPYSMQTADGEIVAMKVGAALWGTANQTLEAGQTLSKPELIGLRYGYARRETTLDLPKSPIFHLFRADGLFVKDFQDVIQVNQRGVRVVDETARSFAWITPCLGGPSNGGGPIWAIFDAGSAKREGWDCAPPHVDPDGYFFTGSTVAELAGRIVNRYQKQPMPPKALEETVARYNSFVDAGKDADFGKAGPMHRIQTPPFYAAWSTPMLHDSRTGLRINAKCQVLDLSGAVIPGLYCGGESAGGFSQHGLGRCIVQGRIAGRDAARSQIRS